MPIGTSFHEQLLDQARLLIQLDRRRPSQANLRRAMSTAYYAVFHLIAEEAGHELVGGSKRRRAMRGAVARALDHGVLRAVCERFSGSNFPQSLPVSLQPCLASVSPDMRTMADDFLHLQEYRHRADYDRLIPLKKIQVKTAVRRASNAIDAWARIRRTDEAALFLLAAVAWKTLAAR